MNQTVVLDTNALIRLFRGESEEVKRAVMGASRIVIPLAVCAEFKAGVEGDSSGRSREVALFREFLSVPNTSVHRPSELTAEYYAKIFRSHRPARTAPLSQPQRYSVFQIRLYSFPSRSRRRFCPNQNHKEKHFEQAYTYTTEQNSQSGDTAKNSARRHFRFAYT